MSSKSGNKKFKWALDFNTRSRGNDLPSPPGFNPSVGQSHMEVTMDTDQSHLILKKSWDIALGPIKQVPMNLLIMYMSGNSISIFPIMMVGMMLVRPIKAIIATQATFKVIEGTQAAGQKIVYFLGNLANVALAVYKCHSMGLLPTHASDWLAFVEAQTRLEYADGGISLI
ncbi:ER membrane protein complex subunit 4 [Contarinia nasturtii]|uniref:ER membrane protein complex subunit 4 n=1 Tax=Contarinia nasturtii TaxID=265458 RepID=UPI0012D390DA|nr:ER membrane protein complex subunit 4 [Contarinia nasturtii]